MSKTKLLIIGSFPIDKNKEIYGGQLTACKALIKSNFSKKFIIQTLNSSIFSNPPPNLFVRSFFALLRIIKLIYKILINKPNVILIFTADKFSAVEKGLMVLISKKLNRPVMLFPRAGALINQYYKNEYFRRFINYSFSKSNIFLCQGKSFQDFAIEKLKFLKEDAPIIPNWTAKHEHLSIGSLRNYHTKEFFPKILFLGWLEDFKGVKEIVKAIKILKRKNYSFHISFAGEGSSRKYILDFIKKNNLQDFISLIGWVDEKEKCNLLKESNIFLLPSWNEGFPNSLVEAMSSGLACVVTNVGMIPDFVKDKEHCLLIRPKNVDEIVFSLEKLFKNEILRQKIAESGYFYSNLNFTVDNGLELLSEEIKKLAS